MSTGNNGGGPQVTFQSGLTGTVSLQAALPAINANYTITGPGSNALTVEGNGNANNPYRIFTVNAGITTTISGLTITGGDVPDGKGGGILNNGDLTLNSDSVTDNYATDLGFGGGIFNAAGAELTLNADEINGNVAGGGGGLFNSGSVTIDWDSQFDDNITTLGGGGGIYNKGTITVDNDVLIEDNEIYGSAGAGAGVDNVGGIFKIFSGSILDNTETLGNGGGVAFSGGTMTLTGVSVWGNCAFRKWGRDLRHHWEDDIRRRLHRRCGPRE